MHNHGLGEGLVVDVDGVIFAAAGNIVVINGETDKVLLILVASKSALALVEGSIPQLKCTIGRGAHQLSGAKKSHIGHRLAMATVLEHPLREIAQIIVVNKVVGRAKGNVVAALGVKLDTADVGFAVNGGHTMFLFYRPNLDLAVVRSRGQNGGLGWRKVDTPSTLFVLFIGLEALTCADIPQRDNAFVVTASNMLLQVWVPAHTANLASTLHLANWWVKLHIGQLYYRLVIKDFDSLAHTGRGKIIAVTVKLYTRDNAILHLQAAILELAEDAKGRKARKLVQKTGKGIKRLAWFTLVQEMILKIGLL